MWDSILKLIQLNTDDLMSRVVPLILALLVSFAMGLLIYYVYTRSFRGVVFNHNFAVSLSLMTTLTTMITLAISSNIALSLGMVGALSIVRYRAAIKDPMDLLFLFWAVTTGITIGANMHYLALVGALVAILTLLVINRYVPKTQKYILLVHFSGDQAGEEIQRLLHRQRFQIKSRTVRQKDVEMAIEVLVKNDNLAFLEPLHQMPQINDFSLVQYTTEFHS